MNKLSLTVLVAALYVSAPVLGSDNRAYHHPEVEVIDNGHFFTQSRSHPQSRLAREAYITRSARADCKNGFQGGACEFRSGDDESVPINRPEPHLQDTFVRLPPYDRPGRDAPQFIERAHDKGVRRDDGWAYALQKCVVGGVYVCD